MTEPLVPPDVDLRDFGFMPLDVRRLLTSETWIEAADKPKVGHAVMSLWAESWHQLPAGSLPDNDKVLARLALCDAKTWKKIRADVLAGWVKCSDGLLYHPVVAEKALESWEFKKRQRARTEAATAARAAKREQQQLARDDQRDDLRNEQRDVARDVHQGTGQGPDKEAKATPDSSQRAEKSGSARSLDEPPSNDPPPQAPDPTVAGRACLAMRRGGLIRTNPADPRLIAACAMPGATDAMWEATAREAVEAQPPKGVAWVIATVTGRIADAAASTTSTSAIPTGATHANSARNRPSGRQSLADGVIRSASTDREFDDTTVIEGTATRLTA